MAKEQPQKEVPKKTVSLKDMDPLSLTMIFSNIEQQKSKYYATAGRAQSVFEETVNYLMNVIVEKDKQILELTKKISPVPAQ